MWLASGVWLLLIRFAFWGAGYAHWGELGASLLLAGGAVSLAFAGLFYVRFARALQRGWVLAAAILGIWAGARFLSGALGWLDYGLIGFLVLTTWASLRARTSSRPKRKLSPLDYPVFG
jgi:hypothetical protein